MERRWNWGAHAPRVPFQAPSLETSGGNVFDEGVEHDSWGGCAPHSNVECDGTTSLSSTRHVASNQSADVSAHSKAAFRIPQGQRTLFLNSVWDG